MKSEHGWISITLIPEIERLEALCRMSCPDIIIKYANEMLQTKSPTVTDKDIFPPYNDKHSYMSLSIYLWEDKNFGFPCAYVTKDGYVNPESMGSNYDSERTHLFVAGVQILTVAYLMTGDEMYAKKAVDFLTTWFVNEDTRMHPNMNYAQFIPGILNFKTVFPPLYVPGTGGSGIVGKTANRCGGVYVSSGGMIELVRINSLTNFITVLQRSAYWKEEYTIGIHKWFQEMLHWMINSTHGIQESFNPGNHGVWYRTFLLNFASFIGDMDIVNLVINDMLPKRLESEIEDSGFIRDVTRSKSLEYLTFALTAFSNGALIAKKHGMDLWNYSVNGIVKLEKAFDWLADHLLLDEWPYENINGYHPEVSVGILTAAYEAYSKISPDGKAKYLEAINKMDVNAMHPLYKTLYKDISV